MTTTTTLIYPPSLKTLLTNSIINEHHPIIPKQLKITNPFVRSSLNRIVRILRDLLTSQCQEGQRTASMCLGELEQIEAFVVDRLNTGHWRCVDGGWRGVVGVVSVLKLPFTIISSNSSPCQQQLTKILIKTCDTGLLMGSPIHNNVLATIAEELCENIRKPSNKRVKRDESPRIGIKTGGHHQLRNRSPTKEIEIRVLKRPSVEEFSGLMTGSVPAKLVGVVEHWGAVKGWDVGYIREIAGERSVPVEIGTKYTSEDWTQKIMTINEFIDEYIEKEHSNVAYIAQHNLFNQIPQLAKDIVVPDYTYLGYKEAPELNAWFGPPNTISPAHTDPSDNILVQVFGTKLIRLFPPSETDKLKPHEAGSLLFNTSSLDVEGDAIDAVHCDLEINGGEAVFIPKGLVSGFN